MLSDRQARAMDSCRSEIINSLLWPCSLTSLLKNWRYAPPSSHPIRLFDLDVLIGVGSHLPHRTYKFVSWNSLTTPTLALKLPQGHSDTDIGIYVEPEDSQDVVEPRGLPIFPPRMALSSSHKQASQSHAESALHRGLPSIHTGTLLGARRHRI